MVYEHTTNSYQEARDLICTYFDCILHSAGFKSGHNLYDLFLPIYSITEINIMCHR